MKSVLVIDTPKSCSECEHKCKLYLHYHDNHVNKKQLESFRHPQCPLKQLPSKEEIVSKYIETTNGQLNGKMMNFIDLIYSDNKEEKE